jgi:hypothetical protein
MFSLAHSNAGSAVIFRVLLEQLPEVPVIALKFQPVNTLVLPQAEHTIEAMVTRWPSPSVSRKACPPHPRCLRMCRHPSALPWYSEYRGLARHDQRIREEEAITRAMPHLSAYLDDLNIEAYVSAPIVSDAAWKKYYSALSVFNTVPVSIRSRPSCRLLRQCEPPLSAFIPCTFRVLSSHQAGRGQQLESRTLTRSYLCTREQRHGICICYNKI